MIDFAGLSPEEREVVSVVARLEAVLPEAPDAHSLEDIKARAGEALTGYRGCRLIHQNS